MEATTQDNQFKGEGIDIDASFNAVMHQLYPKISIESNQYRQSRIVWFAAIRWMVDLIASVEPASDEELSKFFDDLNNQLEEFLKEVLRQHHDRA